MSAATHLQKTYVAQQVATTQPVRYPARRARKKVNPIPAAILCTLLLVGLAIGYVGSKARVMALTYTLAELRVELAAVQREYGYLSMAAEKARSPLQVEKLARERLGMVTPEHVKYLVLAKPGVENDASLDTQKLTPGLVRTLAAWVQRYWPHKATVVAASKL